MFELNQRARKLAVSSSITLRFFIGAFAFCLFTIPAAPQAITVSTALDGLPSGLSVSYDLNFVACPPPHPEVHAGRVPLLTEQTSTVFTPVTLPGGQISLSTRTVTRYVGETTIAPQSDNGCGSSVPPNTVRSFYSVVGGDAEDHTAFRSTQEFSEGTLVPGGSFEFNHSLSAATSSLTSNGNVPTTVHKSFVLHFTAFYSDAFGSDQVITPTLDFTKPVAVGIAGQPNFSFGTVNQSHVKMTLTPDGQVCLAILGIATKCKNRSAGGTLANGEVTVFLEPTSGASGNAGFFTMNWVFRFEPAFAGGDFNVIVSADDKDLPTYLVATEEVVHGIRRLVHVQRALDLLPWKSLTFPVDVTN